MERAMKRFAYAAALCLISAVAWAQADVLDKAAKEKGAVKTESGLIFLSLKEGKGANPQPSDTVRVHYRGYFPDGKEFDSSYKRREPTEFPLNRVIKCWTEGVGMMKAGGKAKLTCPPSIAYGERGAGGVIPPNAVLQFEVELLGIVAK
jgi:FKBP-type peptidyl-prolyl cis-trans isomerase FkpA